MNKVLEKIFCIGVYLFCLVVIIELGINYFSFKFIFPIKNATSYGYVAKKGGQVVIPLNKYSSRFKAQLALPYELLFVLFNSDKNLKVSYSEKNKKFGYVNKNGKVIIGYIFDDASEFSSNYAMVAVNDNGVKKYGSIDTRGNWIILPKYSYLCPFVKYYTKACIDSNHCGVIDRFGNEIALMSYKMDKLNCEMKNCKSELCAIGSKS